MLNVARRHTEAFDVKPTTATAPPGAWGYTVLATTGQACPLETAYPSLGGESQARDGSGGYSLADIHGVGRGLEDNPMQVGSPRSSTRGRPGVGI